MRIYFPQLTAKDTTFPRRLFYGVFCSFDWNLISFLFDKNDKLHERGNKSLGSANPHSYQTSEENDHFLHDVLHFVFQTQIYHLKKERGKTPCLGFGKRKRVGEAANSFSLGDFCTNFF